jgi:hypothetical protein
VWERFWGGFLEMMVGEFVCEGSWVGFWGGVWGGSWKGRLGYLSMF